MKVKAIVIGSGIAGLASAIRLRTVGIDVDVFEMNSYPGGKLTAFSKHGYRFDMGPSLFTMPQFVEELFTVSGMKMADYFSYNKKEIICHYFYEDGTLFRAHADQDVFAEDAAKVFDTKKEVIKKYLEKSKKKYDIISPLFLEKSLSKMSTYFSMGTLKAIMLMSSLDINMSLHDLNLSEFSDKRLVQLFDRYATYNGSSPYKTPGIMSMIPHLEQYYGTYFPDGGMHTITKSLYQLAKDLGVNFHFNTKVEKILVKNRKAIGIKTKKSDILRLLDY